MKRLLNVTTVILTLFSITAYPQTRRYSTGAVDKYKSAGCSGSELKFNKAQANNFATWYNLGGFTAFSRWADGDVWGSDFRDGAGNDLEPQGGSEIPEVYFYSGHGTCQDPPGATDPDFISVCGNAGTPNRTNIGTSSRWGNRNVNFMFLDASCPMDLASLPNNWFPPFVGLHMAIGHSGTSTQDTLDSADRGSQFAAYTAGLPGFLGWLIPELSVGDAWMRTGTIDIQSGCCAVATAAGATEADAVNRRHNEKVKSGLSNPTPNWLAWMWVCR